MLIDTESHFKVDKTFIRKLEETLGLKIVISDACGGTHTPTTLLRKIGVDEDDDNWLKIINYGTLFVDDHRRINHNMETCKLQDEVIDFERDGQHDYLEASDLYSKMANHFIKDLNGLALGEFNKDLMMMSTFFDIFHTDNMEAKKVFLYMLEKAGLITPTVRKKILSDYKEKNFIENLLDTLCNGIDTHREDVEGTIKYNEAELLRIVSNYKRTLQSIGSDKILLKNIIKPDNSFVMDKLNEVKKLKFVENINLNKKSITILLKNIKFEDKKMIGKYTITITSDLKAKVESELFKNILHESGYKVCQHPHINEVGEVCFGNLHSVIKRLYEGELAYYVSGVYELLQTYSNEQPYMSRKQFLRNIENVKKLKAGEKKIPNPIFGIEDEPEYEEEESEDSEDDSGEGDDER